MIRVAVLCLTISFMSQHTAGSLATEYVYKLETELLRLHIVPASWSVAALRCQFEGGVLASPTTDALTQNMVEAMGERKLPHVFIGITDIFSKGSYKSLDGVLLSNMTLQWAPGEPNNEGGNERCLSLNSAGELGDVNCTRVLPFFCRTQLQDNSSSTDITSTTETTPATDTTYAIQITSTQEITSSTEITSATEITPTRDINSTPPMWDFIGGPSFPSEACSSPGYHFEPSVNTCYKFHRNATPWRQAHRTCRTEEGQLAVVNTPTESSILKAFFSTNSHSVITNCEAPCDPRLALIGFRKWDDGVYATIDGIAPYEAGFSMWSTNKTIIFDGPTDCGAIYTDGRLYDVPCLVPFPFICETKPSVAYVLPENVKRPYAKNMFF